MISTNKKCNVTAVFVVLLVVVFPCFGQQVRLTPAMQSDEMGRRLDVMYQVDDNWHTDIRPYTRKDLTHRAIRADSLSSPDQKDSRLQYIFNDNTEWLGYTHVEMKTMLSSENKFYGHLEKSKKPVLSTFYKTPANFLEVNEKDFYLRVNPLLDFDVMPSFEGDGTYFNNRRGIEIRGGLDQKIYFFTNIIESQSKFPNYVDRYILKNKAVPGAGFYKDLESNIIGGNTGHDYLLSQGYIGFQATKHFGLELGHGRHFIGSGIRSLLLSDFANDYFYLSFNTKIWKLQYKSIFAELSANTPRDQPSDELLIKKYYVAHYLSINIGNSATFGFFEAVSFARADHFEFQYLNPAILYRTVEQGLGSPDNVLIGFNGHINIAKRLKIYGQLVLDELKIGELSGDGWWANKFGFQAGLTYIDPLGLKNAELTLEGNLVRPFTYAHRDSISNFAHANQALAHPLGANFIEGIIDLTYRPSPKWRFSSRTHFIKQGENKADGFSLGSDILLSTESRNGDYGHSFLQGIQASTFLTYFDVSYQIRHNAYLDFMASYRDQLSDDINQNLSTTYAGLGIRINMARRRNAF